MWACHRSGKRRHDGPGGSGHPLGRVGKDLELHTSHTNLWSQVMTEAASAIRHYRKYLPNLIW